MECQVCGEQLPQGARTCPNCGMLATDYQATISASSDDATYVTPPGFTKDPSAVAPPPMYAESSPYKVQEQSNLPQDPYLMPQRAYNDNPYYTPPPPRKNVSRMFIGLVAIIALIIIGANFSYAFMRSKVITPSSSTTSSKKSSTNNTTNTNGAPTLNATATANAYYTLFDTTTSRSLPTRDDALSNNSKEWGWDENSGCSFSKGAYHVSNAQSTSFHTCIAHESTYSDFLFEVQMTIVKGSYGSIVFRSDDVGSNFYIFRAGQDGVCTIAVYNNSINTELQHSPSQVFKQGPGQTNTLAVLAQGSRLIFYVNAQYLFDLNDLSFPSGKFGLVAGSVGDPTEVLYRNAKLWVL